MAKKPTILMFNWALNMAKKYSRDIFITLKIIYDGTFAEKK